MEVTNKKSPTPVELIDWLNDEGVIDLDWDFPEDGDLFEAGLDSLAIVRLVAAVEDRFEVELVGEDLSRANLATPATLAALIAVRTVS
jgi:acyl carrier protein